MKALAGSRMSDSVGIQLAGRLVADAFVLFFPERFKDRESVMSTDVDRFKSGALRFPDSNRCKSYFRAGPKWTFGCPESMSLAHH